MEGAAVLRALGEWHACHHRWQAAGDRFLQVLEEDQLDHAETVALDYYRAGAVLAVANDTNRFALFQSQLIRRHGTGKNPAAAAPMLAAGLLLPGQNLESLRLLETAFAPAAPVSIGAGYAPETAATDLHDWLGRFKMQNVGTSQPAGISVDGDDIVMVAGGADIWNTRDGFAYACELTAGDFDFRMQVRSVTPVLDKFTRIGLMAREVPNQLESRHVMVAVNAANTFQVVMRSEEGAAATSVPQNPLPSAYGPNSWVRLQRVGAIFHAYTSSNGVDWTQLYQTTGGDRPFSDPIYFGLAACSHSTSAVATNVVSHFAATPTLPPNLVLPLALWAYRNRDFETAATWCRRLLMYPEANPVELATARVILGMTCLQLGDMIEGRRQIEAAQETLGKKFAGELEPGNKSEGFWQDWVFARALLAEAMTLTNGL